MIKAIDYISLLSLQLHVNLLVYDRNIFGSSLVVFGNYQHCSVIFGNVQKMLGNVRPWDQFWKIFGNLWKVVRNHQKIVKMVSSACLYNKKNITRYLKDTNFVFSWQELYLTHSLHSLIRYSSCHLNM